MLNIEGAHRQRGKAWKAVQNDQAFSRKAPDPTQQPNLSLAASSLEHKEKGDWKEG